MTDICSRSATELRAAFEALELSPVEVIDVLAARITALQPTLNSFMTIAVDNAREEAKRAEWAYARGEARLLEGIPFAVKDIFDTGGLRTTYGSRIFDAHVPTRDARAVERARQAGAILIGKTATDEFACGLTNVNWHYGPVPNPWALTRVSGGSSGGSAVALAAHEVPLALGSDTGGSIRAPASLCGIVGFKPSFGVVGSRGMWPMTRLFDHPGPMARTPNDVALFLVALADRRPWEAANSREPVDLAAQLRGGIAGLRVGRCEDLMYSDMLPADASAAINHTFHVLAGLGCEVAEVAYHDRDQLLATFETIRDVELLYAHRLAGIFPARRDEYSPQVSARLEAAQKWTLDEYLGALANRDRLSEEFERVFLEAELIVLPITSIAPLEIDTPEVDTVQFAGAGRYTIPENLVGLPSCAVRAGFDSFGLPIGVQFVGRLGADPLVLRAAHAFYEATTEIQARWPFRVEVAPRKR